MRWVLGEQSAKSLRGGEMADVIFNGSASRRSLGLAEVTMTFDNAAAPLATDAEEVQITRRVYRSGEGEYLINSQVCRLKDIKDLFLGSGAGTDAYCIIEQGRVDVLLQASTRDRRTIFEEAAGISRFKAKKIETLRKLERVDQNLQRLRDILDEVEKQLRSVKLQAAKAQRYQEYSAPAEGAARRPGPAGIPSAHRRSSTAETAALEGLRVGLDERSAQAAAWETRDTPAGGERSPPLDDELRRQEAALADARQQIMAEETTLGHEAALSADLETELARTRERLNELNARVGVAGRVGEPGARRVAARSRPAGEERRAGLVRALEEELQAARPAPGGAAASQVQADKAEHLEQMRHAARLQNDVRRLQGPGRQPAPRAERLRHAKRAGRREPGLARPGAAGADRGRRLLCRRALAQCPTGACRSAAGARTAAANARRDRASSSRDCAQQRSGLASRIEVLEGLERSHEGLGTGVREVLALVDERRAGPVATHVLGMIADFLHGAPRVRPADRPGPGRLVAAIPGPRRRRRWPSAWPARTAVLGPGQLPAAHGPSRRADHCPRMAGAAIA